MKRYGKYGRKDGKDMTNTEENIEKIGKLQRKGNLNSQMIWKKLWKDMENRAERQVE